MRTPALVALICAFSGCVSSHYDGGRVSERSDALFEGSGKNPSTGCSSETLFGREREACAAGKPMEKSDPMWLKGLVPK